MKIGTTRFRGELPHLAPEMLPAEGAQEATNCRMETGNLEAYRQFALTKALANTGTVRTIYLHRDKWLSFTDQVDIARNVIEDDPDGLLLLTCPALYATPRYTTYALATTGSEPFPVATLPLGVPAPSDIPVLTLGVDSTPTTFSIDTLDEGGNLDTLWVASPSASGGGVFTLVIQDTSGGNPGDCYRLQYDEVSNNSQGPYAFRNFGISTASVIKASTDFEFVEDDDTQRRASLTVGASLLGVGVAAQVYGGNTLRIVSQTEWSGWFGLAVVDQITTSAPMAMSTWYTLTVIVTKNPDGTVTVKAEVFTAAAVSLGSVTATTVASIGDYVGISAASGADAVPRYATKFDNIHVQASGSTGITPNLTATNYVYTFVNDRGWESAPSFPTADILRPDGVTVTVVTGTTAPAGYGAVTLKRIYRLVQGTTGDFYLFVVELPLATASYDDTLSDSQIGPDILQSVDYDLPPATLQGIISLPDGGYAGFFGNQLCLSAAGWPHAWPVKQRYPCESPLTAIRAIDNTIVVGTETVVYTCSGTEPSAYVMSQPGERQACVSKRSMVYLDGKGVAFASPDGYQLCAGSAGAVQNLTEQIFTKMQWQELVPESIIAAVHDGVLHWYYDTTPASTSTVLFLFHFTEETSGEGLAEFTALYGATDQTGALWTADTTDWIPLAFSSPSPKFGSLFMRAGTSGSTTWVRNVSQSDPVLDTVPIGSNTALTIDARVYRRSDASGGVQVRIGSAYPDYFVMNVNEFGTQAQMWGAGIFLNTAVITADQWVNVRMTYSGDILRLFIDGNLILASSSTPGLLATIDPIATMQFTVENFNDGGFMCDEVYASLGTTASTVSFTPAEAPWPNP